MNNYIVQYLGILAIVTLEMAPAAMQSRLVLDHIAKLALYLGLISNKALL
jgi:hypothetical protein